MNENDVAFFGTLLNLDTEAVKGAVEDGTLGNKIAALELLGKDQVETLKTNLSKEVRNIHLLELSESAKRGDLDGELYKSIKGAAYEMLEKDLSKEYKVDEFKDVKDLVAKISNKAIKTDDKTLHELNEKLNALKEVNSQLNTEKEEAISAAKDEYNGKLLARSMSEFIDKVPHDLSDVLEADLEKVSKSSKEILNTVFDARNKIAFEGEKIVAIGPDGKVIVNPITLEPIPVPDVLKSLASELGQKLKSPESGGQGGRSSSANGKMFQNQAEFDQYVQDNKINPYSKEGIKLFSDSGLAVKNN